MRKWRVIQDDDRAKLGWPGRFADVASVAVNFYSTGDVLTNPTTNKIFGVESSNFGGAWLKQELFKGCALWYGVNAVTFSGTEIEGGWDVGNYYIEYLPDGTRYEDSAAADVADEHWLDCQIHERRQHACGFAATNECGSLFAGLSATLPTWLYDADWNLVRLTTHGPAACDAVFKIEVVSSGVLLIVN